MDLQDHATPAARGGEEADPDRILFETGLVRIGAFRCSPCHRSFRDSGPARNYCFVFPRTAVEIQHEHEHPFAANPNVVTFYNKGQAYLRNAISRDGDRCDWFGVQVDIVRDIVRAFDPTVDSRPEWPFRFTRAWANPGTYLMQRRIFEALTASVIPEPLAVEESVLELLERVVTSAYSTTKAPTRSLTSQQRDTVHHTEVMLSRRIGEPLSLGDVACEVGGSPYHLCHLFRRATGTTLHQYRLRLHLRSSLESVLNAGRPLIEIALDAGFCSHSHFTSSFRKEFTHTPSALRVAHSAARNRAIF